MGAIVTATIRVGTWNIREGVPVSATAPSRPRTELIETLLGADLDILALQEVAFDHCGRSSDLEAVKRKTDLRYSSEYSLSPSMFHNSWQSGLAVISRTPHSVESRCPLPNPGLRLGPLRSWDKGILVTRFEYGQAPLWVASIHVHPFHVFKRDPRDQEFDEFWHKLAHILDGLPPGRVIVSGDFNTGFRDLITEKLWRHSLRRLSVPVLTNDAGRRSRPTDAGGALDDILYEDGLAVGDCSVISTFSNHPLLIAEFSLRDESS